MKIDVKGPEDILLGRTAQDVHLDSHTAPELCVKIDVKGPENILLATASVHLSKPGNCTGWGSEGVNNGLKDTAFCLTDTSLETVCVIVPNMLLASEDIKQKQNERRSVRRDGTELN